MTEVIENVSEKNSEIARAWTVARLGNVPYLYAAQLKGVIDMKARFASVKDMDDKDFIWGVYLGLCDHFNGGCELEDMNAEVCGLLGFPVHEDTPISKSHARRLEDEAGQAEDAARRKAVEDLNGGRWNYWDEERLVKEGKLPPYVTYHERKRQKTNKAYGR